MIGCHSGRIISTCRFDRIVVGGGRWEEVAGREEIEEDGEEEGKYKSNLSLGSDG